MRTLTITFQPDNTENQANITTGGVSNLEILDFLNSIMPHFCKAIIKDYQELTNDPNIDDANFDGYVKFLRDAKL